MSDPSKSCFVIMPIRREGTEEHAHFKALYEYTIRPALEAAGFKVVRADEINKAGAITRDIVERLARSDLVVADMTDLNPNVFWELGVRHALHGRGTLTLIDEKRTTEIPFDLGPYRVIKYAGELTGLGQLKDRLSAFALALNDDDGAVDSPVHDWLPMLPGRALEATEGSTEGALRAQVAELRKQVNQYARLYGEHGESAVTASVRPLDVVVQAMEDAEAGSDDAGIRRQAAAAAARNDVLELLATVKQLLEHEPTHYEPDLYLQMAVYLSELGQARVLEAVLEHAHIGYPHDISITRSWLAKLAQSRDSAQRERARRELERAVGISADGDGNVSAPASVSDEGLDQLGFMLDAYHNDGLHDRALRITSALATSLPDDAKVLRNHARALKHAGRADESLVSYRKAALSATADETTFLWYGSELHNRSRYVDAVEVFLVACSMDPDDARYLAHAADDLALAISSSAKSRPGESRPVPSGVTRDTVIELTRAAISCRGSAEAVRRLESALTRVDLDLASVVQGFRTADVGGHDGTLAHPMERSRRIQLIRSLLDAFRSSITSGD